MYGNLWYNLTMVIYGNYAIKKKNMVIYGNQSFSKDIYGDLTWFNILHNITKLTNMNWNLLIQIKDGLV